MTPALLRESGEALYGARWQCDLARDLGVADRTVRRWASGAAPVPEALGSDLLALLNDRQTAISRLQRVLERKAQETA